MQFKGKAGEQEWEWRKGRDDICHISHFSPDQLEDWMLFADLENPIGQVGLRRNTGNWTLDIEMSISVQKERAGRS